MEQLQPVRELKENLEKVLYHPGILACPDPEQIDYSVGVITGGANSDWILAIQAGLDAYITEEMTEHDWRDSRERNGFNAFLR